MNTKIANIGFGNTVASNRIVAIISPESAPVKRMIADAREQKKLIDATYGRKTRAVIVMDSDHLVLTSMQPETMSNRLVD